ncbi:MAG TPA: hypothetical protein GXX36_03425 [Clostridiaceae bacterium]|nr:hypothetical protein [Clostridiaceae bacterium]
MEKYEQLEQLLSQALSSTDEPSEALNHKLKCRLIENKSIIKPVRKRIAVALIAVVVLIMSGSVFAFWRLLSPKQVAENLGDETLAKAFDSEDAIQINKSMTSGDFTFTLMGITSGKNLSDLTNSAQDIHPDRTYAVVSITRKDGSPMPEISDESYGQTTFIVSPLIKGQKPWQVNIFTMNGGYSECIVDGIIYRIIECDSIEMFADRGVYLYAGTGSFIDNQKVSYNEKTGEITINTNSKEAGVLFDLPLDVKKADHEKAEKYLKELLNPEELLNPAPQSTTNNEYFTDWDDEFADGIVIPESIKEVTYDENGFACYEYNGSKVKTDLNFLFKEGETGIWKIVCVNGDENEKTVIQFLKNESGVVTGRTVKKAK